jgi:hypothetical protein
VALASRIRTSADVYEITVSALDISNKYAALPAAPYSVPKVTLDVIGGTAQTQFVDYIIVGTTLIWNAMGLETILSVNDKIRIVYYK